MTGAAKTVLVVDDVPDERSYLSTVLTDEGYSVIEAADGVEALEKVEETRPDLITLDITMPEKSGVAVYRSLKENDDLKDIPIIVVTGVAGDFKQFISSRKQVPPPAGYVAKPIDREEFLEKVRSLLAD